MAQENNNWKGRTDGALWMHRTLIFLLRYIPIAVIYAVMDIVIVFYLVFARTRTSSTYHYFRETYNQGIWNAISNTYLLFRQFGQVVIDRFAVYAGQHFDLYIEGNELVYKAMNQGNGCILISSHVGNYEIAGYALKPTRPMYAVMYGGDKDFVLENRRRELERNGIHVLVPDKEWSYLYTINKALQEGNMITIMGDRNLGSDKVIATEIVGRKANLPSGPFSIASLYKHVTACSVFVMKESKRSYHIYVQQLRGNNKDEFARDFADQLTTIVRRYPHQWYNFYDFWQL